MPEEIRDLVQNYHIHVIDVRKLEDTSIFRTDVKQVFDFIRYSKDKEKLEKLIRTDPGFHDLDEDAFEFMSFYADADYLINNKSFKRTGGKVDMCKGLEDIFQDKWEAGKELGKGLGKIYPTYLHPSFARRFMISQTSIYSEHLPVLL